MIESFTQSRKEVSSPTGVNDSKYFQTAGMNFWILRNLEKKKKTQLSSDYYKIVR